MAFHLNHLTVHLKQFELPECFALNKKQSWHKSTAEIWNETFYKDAFPERGIPFEMASNVWCTWPPKLAGRSCCYGMFAMRYNINGIEMCQQNKRWRRLFISCYHKAAYRHCSLPLITNHTWWIKNHNSSISWLFDYQSHLNTSQSH